MNVRILMVCVERHPKAGLGASASRVVLSPRGALKAVDSLNRLRQEQSSTFQKAITPSDFILLLSVGWVTKVDYPQSFCNWILPWPFQQAKALAEDFPNVVIAKSNQEVEKLQGGNRAVSFDLDLINDLDEYMKTCFEKHLSVPQISGSLHLHELWTLIVLMTRAVSIVVSHFWQREDPKLQWFWRIHVLPQQTCHWTEPVEVVDEVECVIVAVLFKQVNEVTTAAAAGGHFASGR